MHKPRIAIISAGPGGLTLARILVQSDFDVTVFERETYSSARPQGGSLDMHADSGQLAIESCGLTSEFKTIARYEDQESRIYNKHGELLFADTDVTGKDRPEVDRGHLRQMLLDSIPAGIIRWGHPLEAVLPSTTGGYRLSFRGETIASAATDFDLVVGADGAWSRTRALLTDVRPIYSGILFVELGIDDADARHPDLARLVGRGLMFALGDSKAIIGHRDANAHLGIYAAMRAPEDWGQSGGLDWSSPGAIRAALATCFDGWSGTLLQLIVQSGKSGERLTPRPIYALPPGHRWQHRRGLTLLGDAAHLMSPFGGDGANLAMLDAAELALALTQNPDWDAAVLKAEHAMSDRSREPAAGAWEAIQDTFSPDGLSHTLEVMRQQHA